MNPQSPCTKRGTKRGQTPRPSWGRPSRSRSAARLIPLPEYAHGTLDVNQTPPRLAAARCPGSMRENVVFRPTGEVEERARRQELETGGGHRRAALARQHDVEPGAQGMEMEDIRRGIAELLVGQLGGAPIGGLLLFREVDAEQFLAQILEAVPVGEGANQLGGDLGAIDRPGQHPEMV